MSRIIQPACATLVVLMTLVIYGQANAAPSDAPETSTSSSSIDPKRHKQKKAQQAYNEALAKERQIKKAADGTRLWKNFLQIYPGHKKAQERLAYWEDLTGRALYDGEWLTDKEINQRAAGKLEEKIRKEREKAEEEKNKKIIKAIRETWGSLDITVTLRQSREVIADEKCTGFTCPSDCRGRAAVSIFVPSDSLKNGGFKTEDSKNMDKQQSRHFTYFLNDHELSYSSTLGEGRICSRITSGSYRSSNAAAFIRSGNYKMNIYMGARYRSHSFFSYEDHNILLANDVRTIDIKDGKKTTLRITLDVGTGAYEIDRKYSDLTEQETSDLINLVLNEKSGEK